MELNKAEWLDEQVKSVLQEQLPSGKWEYFFDWDFITVWEELGYPEKFEVYKGDFINRSKSSLDTERMIDEAIEKNEIKNLDYDLYAYEQDKIKKEIKLGYSLAINGENPPIIDLIFNLKYEFDAGFFYSRDMDDVNRRIAYQLEITRFSQKFRTLHEVCQGYLRAKFVYFLKGLKKDMIIPADSKADDNSVDAVDAIEFQTNNQKIAWLHALGVVDVVLSGCVEGATYNWNKAASIINSFTEIKKDTIRKAIMAIYAPSPGNQKNDPLKSADTQLFLRDMKKKFKWDK